VLESLTHAETWVALAQICVINVLLSGDNAVVIALACRDLPQRQQKQAFAIGAAGVIVLMTALTAAAAYLLTLPYLEIVGSALLLWIGIKLLSGDADADGDEGDVRSGSTFWGAVRIIIVADIVMSLDNVLGMAGVAKGHLGMLFVGMVITIPMILFGSAMLMKLMNRFPIFITFGAGLLGWVAGEMAVADPLVEHAVRTRAHFLELAAPMAGALLVVVAGQLLARRRASPEAGAEGPRVVDGDAPAAGLPAGPVLLVAQEGRDPGPAIARVAQLARGSTPVYLLTVRTPMPQYVARFLAPRDLKAFHREIGALALAPAAARLDALGLAHRDEVRIGPKAETIVAFAREHGCGLIVLPRPLAGVTLGSLGSQVRQLLADGERREILEAA